MFIGARKDNDSWSWLDGSSWDYTNWGQNQPDGGPTDNCIQIGKLKRTDCNNKILIFLKYNLKLLFSVQFKAYFIFVASLSKPFE